MKMIFFVLFISIQFVACINTTDNKSNIDEDEIIDMQDMDDDIYEDDEYNMDGDSLELDDESEDMEDNPELYNDDNQ